MSYLVDAYSGDISAEEWAARRKAYEDYLDTIRTRLPEEFMRLPKVRKVCTTHGSDL